MEPRPTPAFEAILYHKRRKAKKISLVSLATMVAFGAAVAVGIAIALYLMMTYATAEDNDDDDDVVNNDGDASKVHFYSQLKGIQQQRQILAMMGGLGSAFNSTEILAGNRDGQVTCSPNIPRYNLWKAIFC